MKKDINWKLMIPGLFFLLNVFISISIVIFPSQWELTKFGEIYFSLFPVYILGATFLIIGSVVFTKEDKGFYRR